MATSRFSDTIVGPDERPQGDVEVHCRIVDFVPGQAASSETRVVRTNQQGGFGMDLIQGKTMHVTIVEIGLDQDFVVPVADFGLSFFTPPP